MSQYDPRTNADDFDPQHNTDDELYDEFADEFEKNESVGSLISGSPPSGSVLPPPAAQGTGSQGTGPLRPLPPGDPIPQAGEAESHSQPVSSSLPNLASGNLSASPRPGPGGMPGTSPAQPARSSQGQSPTASSQTAMNLPGSAPTGDTPVSKPLQSSMPQPPATGGSIPPVRPPGSGDSPAPGVQRPPNAPGTSGPLRAPGNPIQQGKPGRASDSPPSGGSTAGGLGNPAVPTIPKSPAQPGTAPVQQPGVSRSPASASSTNPQPGAPARPASPRKPHSKRDMEVATRRTLPGVENMVIRQRVAITTDSEESPPELDWVVRLQSMLPSFSDELTAFLLVALGLLSFLTLLSPASGALGNAWSGTLRLFFGVGAYVISSVILAAGILLLIPKVGIHLKMNWWRVLGGEWLFVLLLAYLHSFTRMGVTPDLAREEALASALEGAAGGLVGWAIQEGLYTVFGDLAAELIMLILIILSAGIMMGITRQHILDVLGKWRGSLMRYAWQLEGRPKSIIHPVMQPTQTIASAPATYSGGGFESTPDPMILSTAAPTQSVTSVQSPPSPRRSPAGPVRVSAFRDASGASVTPRSQREVKYSFTLKDHQDKKKIKKRGSDLPAMELLDALAYAKQDAEEINMNAQIIDDTIEDFGMRVKVIGVKAGPTVTQYAVQPYAEVEQDGKKVTTGRVRVTRLTALGQDLSLALAASRVRIQAPVPGTNYIGVEVPNTRPGIVSLRPVMESERFHKVSNGGKLPLTIALGREVDGQPFAVDLATMPHLLIGGTTGSGKSVCLSAITTCLVTNNKPDELRLIMIDPKMVELVRFNGLPHLLGRVEVEIDRILGVLRWLVREMDRRYKLMEEARARNISVYNQQKKKKDRFPYIVAMIDELAELMSEHPDDTEHLLTRLAQMARATGIHLVVATQRPSVDVLTGLIKANFPSRIAFAVASGVDSRVIIDTVGAEDLIGRGDLLYLASDSAAGAVRLQGCFVSDAEMERVVEFWRANWSSEEESAPWERALSRAAVLEETDQMLEEAIRVIQREGEASTSLLQRKLNISYPRAGRIMDALYKIGAVGEAQVGGRTRVNLIIKDADPTNFIVEWHKRNG